jgi:flagellar hook-length control protein FliK
VSTTAQNPQIQQLVDASNAHVAQRTDDSVPVAKDEATSTVNEAGPRAATHSAAHALSTDVGKDMTEQASKATAMTAPATTGKSGIQADADQSQSAADLPTDETAPIVSVKHVTDTGSVHHAAVHNQAASTSQTAKPASSQESASGTLGPTGTARQGSSSGGSSQQHGKKGEETSTPVTPIAEVGTKPTSSVASTKTEATSSDHQIDRTALVRQVSDKLQALAATRSGEGVVVELAPKALGSITLTVKTLASGMDAHIAATDDHVRKALEQSSPELIQAMQNRGYQVSSVTVSSQTSTTTDGFHQQQQFQSRTRQQTGTLNESANQETNDQTAYRPTSTSLVDISI